MAKQLYDYWFVQFDFPDENGMPYKSSGGKMVWDEKLKREIPEGWHCGNLFEIAVFTNGLACQKFRPKPGEKPLPVIKIREMHDGISSDPEEVSPNIPESVKVYNGDVLFSWSASLEVMVWAYGLGGLNQHIFKVTSANGFPKSFYYFQLLNYVDVFKKMAEARKTTMGHITQDHLQQSTIAIPNDKDIAYKFEKRVSPILTGTVKQQEVISILTKLRDSLLPLLMNGQVSVNYDLASIISQLHNVKKANFANHRGRHVTKFVYICAKEERAREKGSGVLPKKPRTFSRKSCDFPHKLRSFLPFGHRAFAASTARNRPSPSTAPHRPTTGDTRLIYDIGRTPL